MKTKLTQRTLLDLARLPPGRHHRRLERDGVGFDVLIWRGGPGPVLLVNAGTHGDEYEGPTLLLQWAAKWRPRRLRGAVVLVPVLNEAAFYAGQRCTPGDGLNLARVFPGRRGGPPTRKLAWLFDRELIAQATHYIDLHSAGTAYVLRPWVGHATNVTPEMDRVQRSLSACFDRFWRWGGPLLPGRTLSAARERGIPAITTECRGAGGVDPGDLAALDAGLRQVVARLGIVPGPRTRLRRQEQRTVPAARDMLLGVQNRARHDGLFVPGVRLGQKVRRGQRLGQLFTLAGKVGPVRAEEAGRIANLRRQRSVRRGDSLATTVPG